MKTIGNILWFVFTGGISALFYLLAGLILCVTLIGIPFGLQCFKLAQLVVWPFGHDSFLHFDRHPIANIIWILFAGWELAVGFLAAGVVWCITVVGIPFGVQCFKLMQLSFMPFGAEIR